MRMNRIERCVFLLILGLGICLGAGSGHAGQVVTDDLRHWAREAIAGEGALDTKRAANAVSILYFDNQTRRPELDPLQKGLAVMLITDLSKIETIQVVERARVQALLDELNLGISGLADNATAPRVGRLVGAAYLVGGQLTPAGQTGGIRIDSDLLSVARRDAVGRPTSAGPFEELMRMEKEIAFEIVRLLGLELTPAQTAALREPLTMDLRALMLWFKGIDLSDQQQYTQAAEAYQKAVQADPAFKPAASALEELQLLKLVSRLPDTTQVLERLRQRVSVTDRPEPDDILKRELPAEVQTTDVTVRWHN